MTEAAENINLLGVSAKTLKKPLLVEFDPQIDYMDYTSPCSFHLAKMSLHFASASLMASLGLRS
jgi:hypothetical protein